MVGILINENYKYKNVQLVESGAVINAHQVTVEKGEVVRVENAEVMIENNSFSFSIYNYGVEGKKTYNLNSVPENVDGQAIVKEFVEFVENDVMS